MGLESIISPFLQTSRSKRKAIVFSILLLWIVIINLWIHNYKHQHAFKTVTGSIYDTVNNLSFNNNYDADNRENLLDDETIKYFMKTNDIKDVRSIDAHSTNYDLMLRNHGLNSILKDLPFNERCDLYFKNLFTTDMNWYVDPKKDFQLENRYEYSYDLFRNNKLNEVKEAYAKENGIDAKLVEDSAVEHRVKLRYDTFWKKTMQTEQMMTDYISHVRIFNKCYLTSDNQNEASEVKKLAAGQSKMVKSLSENDLIKDGKRKFKPTAKESLLNTDSFESCTDLESRIYKWLSFSFPIYERFTGEIVLTPPDLSKYVYHPEVFKPTNQKVRDARGKAGKIKSKLTNSKACFLQRFKNKMNGKGIVLSIGDKHVSDTVKLIHLLRALNNKFPIEIVYNGGISEASKSRIVTAARQRFIDLPGSFKKIAHHLPDDYFDDSDHGLPKQEVWFVNVQNVIHDHYKEKFDKFANKFLAALFNSFEEYILLDADTVMLQTPEYFFNLMGYKKRGAYFYKDRTAPEFRPLGDTKFFEKMTPSIIDHAMFNIPIVTSHTLDLSFFDGMGHFMESGLVVIDRNLHFNSILMMMQLNFMSPVTSRVYGDKEIFWLAFAINGDEGFEFNRYHAAAIGVETPMEDRVGLEGKPLKSKEICSAHPGHVNGEDGKTLLWFNSGFQFCGQSSDVDYEKEFKFHTRVKFLKTIDEMKIFYQNPIILKHAIVPPFKNKLETLCENTDGEPKEAWFMDKGYCNSYLWCSYSLIGGRTEDGGDNTQIGKFIEFDQKSIDLFSYYGDIWVGNE